MIDGEIVACASEERFSRKKNDESYPKSAIEAILRTCGVDANELDLAVIAGERFDPAGILTHKWSNFSIKDRLREQRDYWYPRIYQKKQLSFLDIFEDKIDTSQYPGNWSEVLDFLKREKDDESNEFFKDFRRKVVSRHLGIDPKKIIFAHHHRAHGYYAYYGSPLSKDKTLIFTADGWGDDMNASVSLAERGDIQILSTSKNFVIGRLYRYITLLLGMKPDEHEYKVMGLAAYAKPKYYKEPLAVFEKTMYVDNLGFAYKEVPADLYFYFRDCLEGYRFDSIAGALQQYTQDILTQWVRNAIEATNARKVCFGGGVAMNIKALMEIAKLPETGEIFVCPTPSDESLAIGAAYVAMHDICVSKREDPSKYLKPLRTAYFGPQADQTDIKAIIELAVTKGYPVQEKPKSEYVAQLLDSGRIIGRCVGRSEFGARALGNRSILADPRKQDIVRIINEKIKCRDFWMPFAPTILLDWSKEYLINPKNLKAPYMTIAFDTKEKAWDDLKAALHPYDRSVRPQIITEEENPEYYSLISEFKKIAGIGGILNTSFNVHGEPIVQTPEDAFSVFERTKLDALILDGYLIEQKQL
jgi:carbamoyltransferase